jgi:RNA polymerase sigma factor (sigma-70 family)
MSTGTTTDIQALLDRLRRGDASAKRELLDRAHHRLVKIASALFQRDFRGLQGRHDLESIVDEAWMGLLRALDSTQPETAERFFGLIFVKVRHALLLIARRQRRHDAPRLNGPLDANEPNALDAFDRGDSTDEPGRLAILSELHGQVELLPDPEKLVFGLHYYLGLTQVEAAEIMGLSSKQVSRLWLQATRRLAKWLKDADGLVNPFGPNDGASHGHW